MVSRQKIRRVALSLHNWMGLLVGIQIIFWFVGGLVMTAIPLDLVRGEVNMAEQEVAAFPPAGFGAVLEAIEDFEIRSFSARQVAGMPSVQVNGKNGESRLYHAQTGTLLSPIDGDMAAKVALGDYAYSGGSGDRVTQVRKVALLTEEPGDFRRNLPVWQISLDDPDGTRLYVSPDTGQVLARRNDYWRVFDFFWMLHIMDYDEREDFNHPLLIITTLTSTLFVLTGVILLYFRFWPWRRRKKP